MEQSKRLPRRARSRGGELLVIRWKHPDGSISSGYPLPRPHAEALARAFVHLFPRQAYWLESVPWM
jgi:hypothetical protein